PPDGDGAGAEISPVIASGAKQSRFACSCVRGGDCFVALRLLAMTCRALPPLRFPPARAAIGRGAPAPGAAAAAGAQLADAFGVLLAAPDPDADAPAVVDASLHVDAGFTAVTDGAVLDAHAIPIGGVAGAGFGDHQDAPVAVEGRRARRGAGKRKQRPGQGEGGECRAVPNSICHCGSLMVEGCPLGRPWPAAIPGEP